MSTRHEGGSPADRVTAREVSDFLSDTAALTRARGCLSPADRIDHQHRKALLLSRIAADLDTPDAHATAADAWHLLSRLARDAGQDTHDPNGGEV